jgi:hypothetical protein
VPIKEHGSTVSARALLVTAAVRLRVVPSSMRICAKPECVKAYGYMRRYEHMTSRQCSCYVLFEAY